MKDYKEQIDQSFERMDGLLNRVISKQEYDYLRGYNVFVKNKERNLKELIEKLNERNSTSNTKDKKINNLELEIDIIRTEQKKLEDQREKQRKETQKWKRKADALEEDRRLLDQ